MPLTALPPTWVRTDGQLDGDPIYPCGGTAAVQRYGTTTSVETFGPPDNGTLFADQIAVQVITATSADLYSALVAAVSACSSKNTKDLSGNFMISQTWDPSAERGPTIDAQTAWFSVSSQITETALSGPSLGLTPTPPAVTHYAVIKATDYVIIVSGESDISTIAKYARMVS